MQRATKDIANFFALCKKHNAEFVDVNFVDLQGKWRCVTMTMHTFDDSVFSDGTAFDGSSIAGFQNIAKSDLIIIPDPTTAFVDTFNNKTTISLLGDVMDPAQEGEPIEYTNNVRGIARRALEYMQSENIADTMYTGPEIEFYLFDQPQFASTPHYAMHNVASQEAHWNTDQTDPVMNSGYTSEKQRGYFTVSPFDMHKNIRAEMVMELEKAGIEVERHHHEVGSVSQHEICIRFDSMLTMADKVTRYKYILRNVAARYGKSVTFMPKPIYSENGNGMHVHQSLWKDGQPLFYDTAGYAGLSQTALYYIGGIMKHINSIMAFGAPTTNSYRRLTPGYEAPVVKAYSRRNRSAAIRIPAYHAENPKAKRIEFRSGDPSANPYLFFSAMLMAGLDGIKNKIEPGHHNDKDLFDLSPEEAKTIEFVPSSLEAAIQALEADHAYLITGNVFSQDFIDRYITFKRSHDVDSVRLRPHPHEFALYYGI